MIVVAYGSLYPFDFHSVGMNAANLYAFLETCCQMSTRGDIVGNIILFVPFGYLGVISSTREYSTIRKSALVCVIGTLFALALQLTQFYLPSRNESLQDVYWNFFGTACGAVLAAAVGRIALPADSNRADFSLIPATLICCWLTYRLLPFVPSMNLQLLKDSLKPLAAPLDPVSIAHDFAAWTIVAYLLRHARSGMRLDMYLPAIIAAVLFLEMLIISNSISASNVAGAVIAVVFCRVVLQRIESQEVVLVTLLLGSIVLSGIAPFVLRPYAIPFNWLPFHGLLGDEMYHHTLSATEKVFLYGSLVYLIRRIGKSPSLAVTFGFSVVMIVEMAQTRFDGHVPEITDPILVIGAALVLLVLERRETESVVRERRITQAIHIRRSQYKFLEELSRELGCSVSDAVRQIVAHFIEELGQDKESAANFNLSIPHDAYQERWSTIEINLRDEHFRFLTHLSNRMNISVSRVVRRIIKLFIAELDEGDHGNGTLKWTDMPPQNDSSW
jgi:VanZ family protein